MATISGLTLTLTRGQDDTTATTHTSGATIYPIFSADEADEANLFTSTMTTRGDLLTMGAGPTVARLAVGGAGALLKSNGTDPAYLALGGDPEKREFGIKTLPNVSYMAVVAHREPLGTGENGHGAGHGAEHGEGHGEGPAAGHGEGHAPENAAPAGGSPAEAPAPAHQ